MIKKSGTPSLLSLKIIVSIFLFFITSFSVAIAASSQSQETNIKSLTIILKNAISGNLVSGVDIIAIARLSGGGEKWVGKKVTDKNGTAVFELDGLGAGRAYYFKATPYTNGVRLVSETIHKPGTFNWKVGTVEVTVRDATQSNSPILINTSVIVSKVNADETLSWFQMVTSDAKGILRLDLPGMDEGHRYVLRAKSTLDNKWKKSQSISIPGTYTFNVGTKPLTVTLKNAISDNPISSVEITVKEKLSDGSEKWAGKKVTDKNGTAVFELDGLGAGRTYYLKSTPYINGVSLVSETIHKPGTFNWKAGTVEVTVRDATQSNSPALINTSVIVSKVNADETLSWFQMVTSDAKGILRLDLPGMDEGHRYVLRAKSTLDNKLKKSQPISTSGTYAFNVGTKPLTVTLTNAISDNPVSDVEITVKEKLSDGSEKWTGKKVTDKNGTAVFELDGLGAGRTYYLKATPYINGVSLVSETIHKPGTFNWKVGTVEVAVRDATQSNSPALINTSVIVSKVNADETLTWFQMVTSDEKGILRLDLPGMDEGHRYVLRAKSTLDNKLKKSQPISTPGTYTFNVGTKPLVITLKNAISDSPVSGVEITVKEKLSDGSEKWTGKKVTDKNGTAVFELDGLGTGRTYYFKTKPYINGVSLVSETIHKPGTFNWKVGTVEVAVRDATQSNSPALINTSVIVNEVNADETLTWFQIVTSDAKGILRLDLPGMDKGRRYVLRAKSTLDKKWKKSQAISTPGIYTFNVGTAALNVNLRNSISEKPVPGVAIVAMELLVDGSKKWYGKSTTDANGQTIFELDGLGEGRKYYLIAINPYGTGNVETSILTSTGDFKFPIGATLVTLLDGDNDIPLSGKRIIAFRITSEQERIWTKSGTTDQEGRIYFDLDGLDSGETFVISAIKPFNENRLYHSKLIRSKGPVTLEVMRAGSSSLDLQPPTIFILSPTPSGFANSSGFLLQGLADDNDKLSHINVAITDSIAGITTVPATYDILTKRWEAPIDISAITPGEMIAVSVTAVDNTNNERTVSAEYTVTTDSSPPIIEIISPKKGASVEADGFIVKGTAVDNIGIVELYASLNDPLLGTTIDRQHINLTLGDTNWMFTIYDDQVSPGEMISLSLEATDAAGNKSLTAVTFKTDSSSVQIFPRTSTSSHILNRITFGATPALLKRVKRIGSQEYISQQLNPHTIDDSVLRIRMQKFKPKDANELQWYFIQYMLDSEHQLNEVMTWFWDNHFNTHFGKHGKVQYELEENHQFRQHALGRFRDLLEISAKSPAMLYYLDSVRNIKAEPNENYARELMELHTLGVDGGYDHHDIESLAKIFTGWRVKNDQFYFDARRHNDQDKNFLGNTITAGGVEEGEAVLDLLATHPSTAFFICKKLGQYFINDTPKKSFTESCADIFLASDGDIKQVLSYILTSSDFLSPINMHIKIKTPIEFITGVIRGLEATPNEKVIRRSLSRMGIRLFRNPAPTGWPETGDNWINPNQILQRLSFLNQVLGNDRRTRDTSVKDIKALLLANNYRQTGEIINFFADLHLGGKISDTGYNIIFMNMNSPDNFDINAETTETRLRQALASILSLPAYQYQ